MLRIKNLYIRYWIILLLFVVLLGWLLHKDDYPGSWQKFILSFTALEVSYNGAWWFLTTFILFVLTSRFWFQLLDKLNPYFYIGLLLLVYIVAFYFRQYKTTVFGNQLLHWFHTQGALYFCTLFQFIVGAFALKYHWHNKVSMLFNKTNYSNVISISGIVLLIVFHGFVPNFIVAPFTALCLIFLFLQMKLGSSVDKVLDFFTPHSTNMWLIHMFFYMIYFKEIIYAPQYPLLIFGWLIMWCLAASYLVNMIYNRINAAII